MGITQVLALCGCGQPTNSRSACPQNMTRIHTIPTLPYRTVSVAGALIDAQQVSRTATIRFMFLASAPGKHTAACVSSHSLVPKRITLTLSRKR
jgi:hypothetical protein